MKQPSDTRKFPDVVGRRFAAPAAVIGSLFAIAMMLYAVDMAALGHFLP